MVESTRESDPASARQAAEDDLVQETVFNFGEYRIRKGRQGTRTILAFAGLAGGAFAQELERMATRCRGDIGLDFSELRGLSPIHIPVLERIRKKCVHLQRSLFLCNPPSRLLDLLSLNGIARLYPIAGIAAPIVPPPAQVQTPAMEPEEVAPVAVVGGREIARLDHSIRRTERLEQNLVSAARCVGKLLPAREPSVPGYLIAHVYRQSEIVGGDFFDYIPLAGGRLGISIGDVSGNGLEAAILMCLARKLISLRAKECAGTGRAGEEAFPDPRAVLARANDDLRGDLDRTTFVTALFGVLEPATGTFRFARAGHERPVHFAPGSGAEPREIPSRGTALGVLDGERFRKGLETVSVTLGPGEGILLFTDGIVDARSPRGRPFSRGRLREVLRWYRPEKTPENWIAALLEEVAHHTGGTPPKDDMMALLIKRDFTGVAQG